ncbi:MAG: exodeoxyribonuclease VII large subunit [Candidatus Staskawiczbacteria bacterium]|nr:exodeoxyribonuclease VII large subunit [Candidatus Staskawiczbacteria bacterium]
MDVEKDKIYSISEFVAFLNISLKSTKAKIIGEVGEAKAGPTGHFYFTLKDEKNGAMLNCIIWAGKYRLYGVKLEPGVKIVAFGNPEVYAPNGRLSFIAETIELAGAGNLKKQYDELRKKLEKEKVFDLENKRPLPKYPQKIGVITAKQGAVIHDFLTNIKRFGFKITFVDSRVEGQEAVVDLLSAVRTFRNKDIDVLVLIRGGGSMESLMAFNNELLVREIAGFPVPVIVGIGHDKDMPLTCLAADKSESTPTAVANVLSESWEQALLDLERNEKIIFITYKEALNDAKLLVFKTISIVRHSGSLIAKKYQVVENKINISFGKFKNMLQILLERIKNAEKIIILNNPERQLKLGYSIASINGKIIRKTNDTKQGDNLNIKVSDGIIESEVKNIKS